MKYDEVVGGCNFVGGSLTGVQVWWPVVECFFSCDIIFTNFLVVLLHFQFSSHQFSLHVGTTAVAAVSASIGY